jgi:aminopeptidase
MTEQRYLRAFADLAVRVGVNVQPGQGVVLFANTAHLDTARAVVEQAYGAGAAWVEVLWSDGPMRRAELDHASLETLTADRPWAIERTLWWADEGAAFISLSGNPDAKLMEGVDPARAAAVPAGEAAAHREALLGRQLRWTALAAPNPGWAEQVFGEPDVDRLWDVVGTAMRLDEDDPVTQWRDRAATLAARAGALDRLDLTSVRYHGDGTDLTVGLIPGCRWTGGGLVDPDGLAYMPNLPTEEVFTSPDRRLADGVIRLTRPALIGGVLVEGLRAVFEGGRIVDVTADSGADAARAQLDVDRGARSLGEVSLVDRDARVARAGIVFHNVLFDENTGCHVAWGQSFPFSVDGGLGMSQEQRSELGLNTSAVHTDVVIGGDGLTVTGTGPGGTVEIIKDDEWVLPVA